MILLEALVKTGICLDADNKYPSFGSDQMYVDYPVRFATATFEFEATDMLVKAADQIFKHEKDTDVAYRFFYGINDIDGGVGDGCITVLAEDISDDTDASFYIDLSEEEQRVLLERLDNICRNELGMSCKETLAKARNCILYN